MDKQEVLEGNYEAVVVGSGYGGSVAACRLSMAGIRVCLIEKGRKWEAQDFPTDSFKILSAVRMESPNLGISYGPKDALFQMYEQNDSLAAVACGLGGGSLVNAGVMVPAPVRARRHPKWPKEWERSWASCEASASDMLKIQSVPVKFSSAKILEDVANGAIGETIESPVKLSVNFDIEEPITNAIKPPQMGSCLACGNCLSGCPYNAKSSTDKNYILSAIQAGCTVKTECQVQYVVRNMYKGKAGRRWLIYLNEFDYITSDFVILSAGVFGTTKILFQSQMRGLKLSEALGSGFSCNGNTVAYLAGTSAPLNGFGLDRKQVFKTPFEERPGPSISSSFNSSLGFTIQSAVLPIAYPHLLFKGIVTCGWPAGYWFFHGIIDKIRHILGSKASQAMVLIALGHDESDGKITLQRGTNKICFTPPQDPLLLRKITAFQKLTKKLGGVLFMSKYRSTAVHLLGGCNASSDPSHGVCNPKGQVFEPDSSTIVHPGLYVCDASLIPCSVGINPSLTISTAAEHISRNLVQEVLKYKSNEGPECVLKPVNQVSRFLFGKNVINHMTSIVTATEIMRGYVGGMQCTACLKMRMNSPNQTDSDVWKMGTEKTSDPLLSARIGGYVQIRAIEKDDLHVIVGNANLCAVDGRTPYTQYMHYHLLLAASTGSRYILEGRKIMNPYFFPLYALREATTLHVTLEKVAEEYSEDERGVLKGELSISIIDLLKSFTSLRGKDTGKFLCLLLGSILRTYFWPIPRVYQTDLNLSDDKCYPRSTLHQITAEDGFIISCRQWKSEAKGDEQLNPVLLLNAYAIESFCLPTEPNDLVRTLLEEGHEIWLLQSRLHPQNPSNDFTIEDVGKFDISAAINKILEFHAPSAKVHVVAHCVGGSAIHIAIMGGHVSATRIASLSCTNSSMFFNLNALSTFKMWLPLIPMSMFILGKDKTLPLLETSRISYRHRLLKLIASFIPRSERCTCYECEIFSGVFGNAFWHENITPTLHQWLTKQNTTRLPMAAFPHLRKMCKSGFIVDSNGCNSYLIHPERMALPTLYISGGRSLLVTPQTSFLAHKYMKLHQPGLRHERVVVEGFGHSDLLIGEDSKKKVFPHILSHIRLAEQGKIYASGRKCSKEALDREADEYFEGNFGEFGTWFSPSVVMLFLISLYWLVVVFPF